MNVMPVFKDCLNISYCCKDFLDFNRVLNIQKLTPQICSSKFVVSFS